MHIPKTYRQRCVLGICIIFMGMILFSMPHKKIIDQIGDVSKMGDFNYLMTLMDPNRNLFYLLLPSLGGMLAMYFVVTKIHKLPWVNFSTSRSFIDKKRILFSFCLWGGVSMGLILATFLMTPEDLEWNFNAPKFAVLFVIAIVMIPIQTSLEEFIFRGYLMQGLGVASKTNWLPLVVTSVVFGLMHLANPEVGKLGFGIMFFYIGTGFLLGIMTLMDEGMELSLGFHAANNLMTALMVTTDWTAFQTYAVFKDISEPSFKLELLAMAVLYPLLIVVFAKKYHWKDWKGKLI